MHDHNRAEPKIPWLYRAPVCTAYNRAVRQGLFLYNWGKIFLPHMGSWFYFLFPSHLDHCLLVSLVMGSLREFWRKNWFDLLIVIAIAVIIFSIANMLLQN